MYKIIFQFIISMVFILYDYSKIQSINLKTLFFSLFEYFFKKTCNFAFFYFNKLYTLCNFIYFSIKIFFLNKENYLYIISFILFYFLFKYFIISLKIKYKIIFFKVWDMSYLFRIVVLFMSFSLICFFKFIIFNILSYFFFY